MHNTPFPPITRLRRGRTKICNLETVSQAANLTNDTKPLKIMVANRVLVKTKISPGKRSNQYLPPLEFLRTDPCQSRIRTLGNTEKEKIIEVLYSFKKNIYHKNIGETAIYH